MLWRVGDAAAEPGWAAAVDAACGPLVDAGLVVTTTPTATGVEVTLAPGSSWPAAAHQVRTAVQDAVRLAASGVEPRAREAALRTVAEDVVGDVTLYAAGHGGGVELLAVTDDVVQVRMHGACRGCPAAAVTVHGRLERAMRARAPWLREVEVEGGQPRGWLSRIA